LGVGWDVLGRWRDLSRRGDCVMEKFESAVFRLSLRTNALAALG
jgi:hypothetical protein